VAERGGEPETGKADGDVETGSQSAAVDMADIKGQSVAKRALEIAGAGGITC